MAKIGNEAKLILKLAEERMSAKVDKIQAEAKADPEMTTFSLGYFQAFNDYNAQISDIVRRLVEG